MSRVAIVAYGAISGLGEARDAASAGTAGAPARVAIAPDDELTAAGLARPFAARARVDAPGDRATALLRHALASCASELDVARPGWRGDRVGLVLGTSSGGMRSAEALFDRVAAGAPPDARDRDATYFAPMHDAAAALGVRVAPASLVLGACASSTIAIGLASRWLETDACDVAIAGGFDAVSVFVAAGFEALRATTATPPPRPFRVGRDGMSLGEGAAVLALARTDRARVFVTGFGATADGVHLTAPDRAGGGVARAAEAALRESGVAPDRVALVSPHATATPFNDPAEWRGIVAALAAHAAGVPLHPYKAQIGHTLGAAGALELLACVDAVERGVLPASAGEGALDPDAPARLLAVAEPGTVGAALKLSSAFGGANAALVVAREGGTAIARRDAFVTRAVHVDRVPDLDDLAARTGILPDRLGRMDDLTRLALDAVARLVAAHGPLTGAAIVVGQSAATIETNATYFAKIRARGARFAEPRRFPYTSPNAVAGECSLAFGLTGPSFAVGAGLTAGVEALGVAALLVSGGDAERAVVVAVDEIGDVARRVAPGAVTGAVATLVVATPHGALARIGDVRVALDPASAADPRGVGHLALVPLASDAPTLVEAAAGAVDARIELLGLPR